MNRVALLTGVCILMAARAATAADNDNVQAGSSISGNSAPVVSGNQVSGSINLTVNQGWSIERQAVVTSLNSDTAHPYLDAIDDIDLFAAELRQDKDFAEALFLLTGATSELNVPKALEKLDKAIDQGSGLAAELRGLAYQNGWWKSINRAAAWKDFLLAADRGVPGAQVFVQDQYWNGSDQVSEDRKLSTKYVEKLVHNEHADRALRAQYALYLANRYNTGDGAPKEVCSALELYAVSAALGGGVAARNLGWEREWNSRCGLQKDEAAALSWYEKGAAAGDGASAENAGRLHQFGADSARDYVAAERFYLAASTPFSDRQLAWIYGKGLTSPKKTPDYGKALFFARRAADAGDGQGAITVGLLFEYGLGVDQNAREAFRWYGQGAHDGEPRGLINQAVTIMNGCVGLEELPNWLDRVTKLTTDNSVRGADQAAAYYHLGMAYEYGLGGAPKDTKKGPVLFDKSCKLGNADACAALVTIDTAQALKPGVVSGAKKAAETGMRLSGTGCTKSLSRPSSDPEEFP